MLCKDFPADRSTMAVVARRFNSKMQYYWHSVVDFLKLHYVLNRREDCAYWRDHRAPDTCPDSLTDKLLLWQQQAPWHDDAPRVDELFPSASYQYVLYGMGFEPRHMPSLDLQAAERNRIDAVLHAQEETARQLLKVLPGNRDLLREMTALPGVA